MKALMQFFCGVLVLVYVVNALPADRIESLELDRKSNSESSEEYPIRPFIPLDGFLSGFNEMFERLRQQMIHLLSQVPPLGSVPEGGNTTSVTKVINGHKVIINETVYASPDGEDAAAVFKVRVVDIRPELPDSPEHPENSENSEDVEKSVEKSVESVDESEENEIPKNSRTSHAQKRKIAMKDFYNINALESFKDIENFDYPLNNNLETFDDVDSTGLESFDTFGDNIPQGSKPNLETFDEEPLGNSIESTEDEDRAIIYKNKNKNHHEIDLSGDIRINTIAEKEGRPRNPDAEILDIHPARPYDLSRDTLINEIAARRNVPRNPDAEMIDNVKFERIVPFSDLRDLSRDTYVNEVAARRRMPLNPDAEFMDLVPQNSRYFYRTHHENS